MVSIESPSVDPRFNLALEEHVFETLPRDRACCMLWQNDRAVIVGRYQNTAREVNDAVVREQGIRVVRRLSGGGAVYHDLGNLNFTFITAASDREVPGAGEIDCNRFFEPVIGLLRSFGVQAARTGRNDLTLGGAKFSGGAWYRRQGRVLYHGTLLYDCDLGVMSAVLCPGADKFEDKAVQSVRSRVCNLKPFLAGADLGDLKEAFLREVGKREALIPRRLTPADLDAVRALSAGGYETWDWNYGRNPAFQGEKRRRIPGMGTVEVHFSTEGGRLQGYTTSGDYFGEGDHPELLRRLLGCPLEEGALNAALGDLDIGRYYRGFDRGMDREEFIRLLVDRE